MNTILNVLKNYAPSLPPITKAYEWLGEKIRPEISAPLVIVTSTLVGFKVFKEIAKAYTWQDTEQLTINSRKILANRAGIKFGLAGGLAIGLLAISSVVRVNASYAAR